MTKSSTAPPESPVSPPVHGYVPAFDTADGSEDPAPVAVTESTLPETVPTPTGGNDDAGTPTPPVQPKPR